MNESVRYVNMHRGKGSLRDLVERMAEEGWTLGERRAMPVVINGVRYDRFTFVPLGGVASDRRAGAAPP